MPQQAESPAGLPVILAGPLLRHCNATQLTLWLATSRRCDLQLQVFDGEQPLLDRPLDATAATDKTSDQPPPLQSIAVGEHCVIQLVHCQLDEPLPCDRPLQYELLTDGQPLRERLPHLCYEGEQRPGFMLRSKATNLLHGSCRKPHHPSDDGLLQADRLLQQHRTDPEHCPALMLFTGDQVYADDVAGPTLWAIHQLVRRLGLFGERFSGATVDDTGQLLDSPEGYYHREKLLPETHANQDLLERFFMGARKPIFTAAGAHNHLISFSEMMAMYLLVWSPVCWQGLELANGLERLPGELHERYRKEQQIIETFVRGLPQVQRLLAHIPTYMIFDDHDVTDDWNLTRGWEEAAYGHPFSKRIIGNALTGYWLCQGWGNSPQQFTDLNTDAEQYFPGDCLQQQDELIERLLHWDQWHYQLDTQPAIIVLDTRTHRWRSESSPNKPSGLMDWEHLSDLQQTLIGLDTVILVSPAPIFGVKLIEAVQRVFTFFRRPLLVDAENWMSHRGAASVLLNIFRHPKTPPLFVVLSGDVHYSFVYDVALRFRRHGPDILQVTASGIKNRFPEKLLTFFDRCNRWLYGSASPLNYLTKRRAMRIRHRRPLGEPGTLYNESGIGQLLMAETVEAIESREISRERTVVFEYRKED